MGQDESGEDRQAAMEALADEWDAEISAALGKPFHTPRPIVPFSLNPIVRTVYPVYKPFGRKMPWYRRMVSRFRRHRKSP